MKLALKCSKEWEWVVFKQTDMQSHTFTSIVAAPKASGISQTSGCPSQTMKQDPLKSSDIMNYSLLLNNNAADGIILKLVDTS